MHLGALSHPSKNQETIPVVIYPLGPQRQHSNQRRERTTEEKRKKKRWNSFTPKTWVEAQDLWSDGTHTEKSVKDFNCRGAENGVKIATKAAYAFDSINFIKLAVWEENNGSLFISHSKEATVTSFGSPLPTWGQVFLLHNLVTYKISGHFHHYQPQHPAKQQIIINDLYSLWKESQRDYKPRIHFCSFLPSQS